jgi:hypothetical protein
MSKKNSEHIKQMQIFLAKYKIKAQLIGHMGAISEFFFHNSTLPLGCHHRGKARVLWIATLVAPQWKGAMKTFF